MSRIRPLPLILTAATVFAFGAAADADVYTYRVVSRTGDAAPGTLGGTFTSFGYPSLNEKGTVGFAASTTAVLGQSGIWMTEPDDPQSVQLVAGTNYIPPGSPASIRFGTFGFSFHHAILTDDDTIGFSAPLTGLPVGDGTGTGLFRRSTGGMLETVLRPGQPAPGLGGGAIVDWISNLPTMNAYGRFAFSAALSGAGITPANDSAVYTHWFGGLTMLAREGGAVPGHPGQVFGGMDSSFPFINTAGTVAFSGTVPGVGDTIWSGFPGLMDVNLQDGEVVPGVGTINVNTPFWGVHLDNFGVIGFGSIDGHEAIMHHDGTTLSTIARVGAAGPLGVYTDLESGTGAASDDGYIFVGRVGGSGATDSAIFRRLGGGATTVVAREGDHPYGFWAGVEFDDLFTYPTVSLDDSGRAFVRARVRGLGVNNGNNMGLWSVEPDGTFNFIMRTGQWIDLGDGGGLRQVEAIILNSEPGTNSGRGRGVNTRGDAVVRVSFTDDTQAIIVAQLPPACPGDVNEDGIVDAQDLAMVLAQWDSTGPVGTGGDANLDGLVDAQDLAVVLANWNHVCEG